MYWSNIGIWGGFYGFVHYNKYQRFKKNLQIKKDLIEAKKMTYDLKQNHLKMDLHLTKDYSSLHAKFQLFLTFFGGNRI